MRVLLLVGFCFLCLSCEDKQSKSKTKNNTSKTEVKVVEKDTTPIREYPYVSKDNVMDFFLDYEAKNKENKVRIITSVGDIDILLYDKTKFHRANFIFLTKQGAFDNTQFHRVVKNFIIQGGNTDNVKVAAKRYKIGHYLLPTDTKRGYTHRRGVISMPSSEIENPHKLASPYEFFITQQDAYHLDGDYTVFGEVIKGMDIVDKINDVRVDEADWPLRNIYIKKVEIID
ncbi:peptidylprolyl isomerase [Olleya sp. Bg11-27]|uniref:peptidylprolyl isomerase n=1 Tax=Olleya sp. Bg11-27 TaxID=2058135 RepID=UPI000C30C9E4|nr:peptidylprolyl isomerase [Olleya sp. Bg11-27]AUC77862.1 peptidylprolyl isomerase [Olleya sp. Bg11-27]